MNPIKIAKNLVLAAAISATAAQAQEASVPNVFEAGQAAKASEVNANFNALADAINGLSARLDAIEESNSQSLVEKLSGRRFELKILKTEVNGDAANNYSGVGTEQGYGLITLHEDGTYEYYYYFENGALPINEGGDTSARNINVWANGQDTDGDGLGDGESETGTWTVTANNSLQLNRAADADFAAYYFRLTPSGEAFASQEYFDYAAGTSRTHYRAMLFVGVLLPEAQP